MVNTCMNIYLLRRVTKNSLWLNERPSRGYVPALYSNVDVYQVPLNAYHTLSTLSGWKFVYGLSIFSVGITILSRLSDMAGYATESIYQEKKISLERQKVTLDHLFQRITTP